ncbi:hypothetical protein ACP4OV_021903 [Aristida adscensionis]
MTSSSTGAARAAAGADVMAEAELWWLRFNNGVADDDDAEDGSSSSSSDDDDDDEEEEAVEGAAAGERAEMAASGGGLAAPCAMAGCWEAGAVLGDSGFGRADAGVAARDQKMEEADARGGGRSPAGAEDAAGVRRCSLSLGGCAAAEEEISGATCVHLQGELPQRKGRATVKRPRLQVDGVHVQKEMAQAQYLSEVVKVAKRVHKENDNLRLQLEHQEIRSLKLELIMKEDEIKSLRKQIEELKAENENLKKIAKPPRTRRKCSFCKIYVLHDYRNCPKRRKAAHSSEDEEEDSDYRNLAASSSEEKEGEDSD